MVDVLCALWVAQADAFVRHPWRARLFPAKQISARALLSLSAAGPESFPARIQKKRDGMQAVPQSKNDFLQR